MNCEKNYNHTLSRVRAYAHSRSFCLFAVTSVTAVSVNSSFSVACVLVCAIFNNKTIRVFKFRLTCQQKSRFVLLRFAKFLPSFPPISFLGVTLVTAKKQHCCWNARATRTREENAQFDAPFFLVSLFCLLLLDSARITSYNSIILIIRIIKSGVFEN